VLNTKNWTLDAYVVGNAARPLLSHGSKGTKADRRSYLFVEALRKFEQEAKEMDLTEAYKKARPAFIGRLERTFVVLKDIPEGEMAPNEGIATGSNKAPVGSRMDIN